MDETIKKQILVIRALGLTNMFDTKAVQYYAFRYNFFDLVTYIEEHKKEYVHFIMTGEE